MQIVKNYVVLLVSAALLASAAAFAGCEIFGGKDSNKDTVTAKTAGTWRVFHTPNAGSEQPAYEWGIGTQPGNDAALIITRTGTAGEFTGSVSKYTITVTMPDGANTVTFTGTITTVTDSLIGSSITGTYSSTSGETGTWRAANLAYVTVTMLYVTPTVAWVVKLLKTYFTATATYSDGYTEDVTNKAETSWDTNSWTIATMSGHEATGWNVGDAYVYAVYKGMSGNTPLLHVINGYVLGDLNGAWLMNATNMNHGYDFFITNGAGNITFDSFYSTSGSNTYSVQNNGPFTLTITPISGPPTFDITGTLTSPSTGTGTGTLTGAYTGTITRVSPSKGQGAWSGTLSTGYAIVFTIKADGRLDTTATNTITGGTINSGALLVSPDNLCSGYFTTSLATTYNAFRISGTFTSGTPATISGNFDNDSADPWPVGTVSLTK